MNIYIYIYEMNRKRGSKWEGERDGEQEGNDNGKRERE